MPATQSQQQGEQAADDDIVEGQPPPTPDQDGPHDVPDDTVIEKTLPTGPVGDIGN